MVNAKAVSGPHPGNLCQGKGNPVILRLLEVDSGLKLGRGSPLYGQHSPSDGFHLNGELLICAQEWRQTRERDHYFHLLAGVHNSPRPDQPGHRPVAGGNVESLILVQVG